MTPKNPTDHPHSKPLLPDLAEKAPAEMLRSLCESHPELLRTRALAALRERLAAVFNNRLSKEQNPHVRGVPLDALMVDLALGMHYVEGQKGRERVVEYLKERAVDKLIGVGHTVRRKHFEEKYELIEEKNNIGPEYEPRRLSGRIYQLWDAHPKKSFTRLAELDIPHEATGLSWNDSLKEIDEIFTFAEKNLIDAKECTTTLQVERSSTREILDEHNDLGFVELFVFVETFCQRFGLNPHSHFSIEAGEFERFSTGLELVKHTWRWKEGESDSYLKACRERFPDEPIAEQLLTHYMKYWLRYINGQGHFIDARHRAMEQWIKRFFPSHVVAPDVDLNLESDIARKTERGSPEKMKENTEDEGFAPFVRLPLNKLLKIRDRELWELIHRYPKTGSWHLQLLDRSDPKATAAWINRLATVSDEEGTVLAARLTVMLMSLEPIVLEADPSAGELVDMEKSWWKGKRRETFAYQVYRSLSEELKEDIERETPGSPIMNLILEIDGVDWDNSTVSEFLHPHIWHPAHSKRSDIAGRVIRKFPTLLQKMRKDLIEFLLGPGRHLTTTHHWAELMSMFSIQKAYHPYLKIILDQLPEDILLPALSITLINYQKPFLVMPESTQEITLDLPYRFLVDSDQDTLRIPKGWKGLDDIMKHLPEAKKNALVAYWKNRPRNFSDDFPDLFMYPEAEQLFTKSERVEEQHLELIRELCEFENHGLREIITEKSLTSSKHVREAIKEILNP